MHYTVYYKGKLYPYFLPVPDDYERLNILNVYPSQHELPANLLKWHLSFSAPISTARVTDLISIIDQNGQIVDRAFLKLETVLLSKDQTVLTLWVEPGRQKRGLGPNKKLGPVFEINKDYTLRVSADLKDRHGVSMLTDYTKSFTIIDAVRTKVNPSSWEIVPPSENEELAIHVTTPLDYISALHSIALYDWNDQEVTGDWLYSEEDHTITFLPATTWERGDYYIEVQRHLEDIAGNNVNRLFDEQIDHKYDVSDATESINLYFTVE